MKMFILIFEVIIFLSSIANNCSSQCSDNYFMQNSFDTIRCDKYEINKSCNRFHKRFGVIISDYYILMDSLAIDLNRDSMVDTLIILSPISLVPGTGNYNNNFYSQPKRLLVEVINENGKSKIRNIYSNLVTDVGGVLSHYNGIYKSKDGFKIVHQSGAKYSWLFTVYFSTSSKDELTIIKISKSCSYEGKEKILDYYYKNKSMENINIPDSLRSNCNCDKYWLDLERNNN